MFPNTGPHDSLKTFLYDYTETLVSDPTLFECTTRIAFDFISTIDDDMDTMQIYEALCHQHFLLNVSYMKNHTTCFVDNNDNHCEHVLYAKKNITHDIHISNLICPNHGDRDHPGAISLLQTSKTKELDLEFIQGIRQWDSNTKNEVTNGMKSFRTSVIGQATLNTARNDPQFFEALKRSVQKSPSKRYLPIFGTFISQARHEKLHTTYFRGSPLFDTSNYPNAQLICTACQTERFFCALHYDTTIFENNDGSTSFFGRSNLNPNTPVMRNGKRLYADIGDNDDDSKEYKRQKTLHVHGVFTSIHSRKNDKDDDIDCQSSVTNDLFDFPKEIIEDQILNRFILKSVVKCVRGFNPDQDSVGSITNYVVVKKKPTFENPDDSSLPLHAKFHQENERSENVSNVSAFKDWVLSKRKHTEHLVLDGLDDLLNDIKTISLVCKSWNEFSRHHFVWQIIFQGIHTLFNSGRVGITMERVLSTNYPGTEYTLRYKLMNLSKKVHGLYDCHIFASYTINIFTDLMFLMINQSIDPIITHQLFKKSGVFHSLVRLVCNDTLFKWKNKPLSFEDDGFTSAIETCWALFFDIMTNINFGSNEVKNDMMLNYEKAVYMVKREKSINVINT